MGVKLMIQAWDLVSVKVVLNGWIATGLLVDYQVADTKYVKEKLGIAVKSARKLVHSTVTRTEGESVNG